MIVVNDIEDVPDGGGSVYVDEEGRSVVVLRMANELWGYINICPHFQIPLNVAGQPLVIADDGLLMCAYHCAVFQFQDGLCVDGPCKGAALTPIEIQIR